MRTPPAASRSARSARAIRLESLAVALAVFIAYAIARPHPVATLGRLYDDAVYLSIGKSIADGSGYRSAHLVGTPIHVKFPPLLPAVYAVFWRAFDTLAAVATAALWLNILVTAACAGVLWWLARRELEVGPIPAGLLCITPLLTARTMFYFSGAMGEPWMLLGWTTALVLVRHLARLPARGAAVTGAAVALGLALAATALARTQGIAVAFGIMAGALFSGLGRRALAAATAAMATPLVIWAMWHGAMVRRGPVSPLPDQTSYLSWIPLGGLGEFTDFAALMARMTLPLYWRSSATILVGWQSPKTALLAGAFLVGALIGLVMLARRFPALTASAFAIVGVLTIWPYAEDRFLTPLLPVLGLASAYAFQRVVDALPRVVQRIALAGAACVALAVLAVSARTRVEALRGQSRSPFVLALDEITTWVNQNTSLQDRVMTPWGGVVYLRTGRRTSIDNPEEPAYAASVFDSPRRFYATRLLADSVDVVVIWDKAPGRAAPWLRGMAIRCPQLLTEAASPALPDSGRSHATAGLHFYRVRRDLPCLQRLARGETVAAPENKNAP